MNTDWLKITGFIIPLVALFLNFYARLKRFTNERISVYKDLKPLCSDVGMEPHEIKIINNEKNSSSLKPLAFGILMQRELT